MIGISYSHYKCGIESQVFLFLVNCIQDFQNLPSYKLIVRIQDYLYFTEVTIFMSHIKYIR